MAAVTNFQRSKIDNVTSGTSFTLSKALKDEHYISSGSIKYSA